MMPTRIYNFLHIRWHSDDGPYSFRNYCMTRFSPRKFEMDQILFAILNFQTHDMRKSQGRKR